MSSIPPSLPPSGPLPTSSSAAGAVTVVADPAGVLADMAAGTVIEVTTSSAGNPARTAVSLPDADASLQIRLTQSFPAGTTLQLQIAAADDHGQLRLLSVNGQPVAGPGRTSPPQPTAALPGTTTDTSRVEAPAAMAPTDALPGADRGITATLLTPGPDSAADGMALPAGTTFTVRIATVQPPPPPTVRAFGASAGLPPGMAAPDETSFTDVHLARQAYGQTLSQSAGRAPPPLPMPGQAPAPTATAPPTAPLPAAPLATAPLAGEPAPSSADAAAADVAAAGETAPAPGTGPAPASQNNAPTPSAAAAQSDQTDQGDQAAGADAQQASSATAAPANAQQSPLPPSLTGTVLPNSHGGLPLLQTPIGLLSLKTATDLPAGSVVTVEPQDDPVTPDGVDSGDDGDPLAPGAPWGGAGLGEAMALLRQIAPHAVLSPAAATQDFAGHLAAVLIGLTAAVETGNVRAWLGERLTRDLDKAGHRDAAEHLEKALATLKSQIQMPLPGDWQCLILPLPIEQRIERIRLLVRRRQESAEKAGDRRENGTRFLIDVSLSRLGALQIDGLLQRSAKRFDVILRTHAPLPENMRQDIRGLFAQALENAGLVGSASFRQTPTFVEPLPDVQTTPNLSGWIA